MNYIKLERIKREIDFADAELIQVDKVLEETAIIAKGEQLASNGDGSLLNTILKDNMSDSDSIIFINRCSYKLALICEHYLKALTIFNMHFDDLDNESDSELERIFSNRVRDGGITSFRHHLDKMIFDNRYISLELQYKILVMVVNKLNDEKLTDCINQMHDIMNDSIKEKIVEKYGEKPYKQFAYSKILEVIKNIYTKTWQLVDKIRDSFIRSRYGMFEITEKNGTIENYIADIDFLMELAHTLQSTISSEISQCLFIFEIGRHIFYDLNTDIIITYQNDDKKVIHVSNNIDVQLEYSKKNAEIMKKMLGKLNEEIPIQKYIKEILYVENGVEKCMAFNELIGSYMSKRVM